MTVRIRDKSIIPFNIQPDYGEDEAIQQPHTISKPSSLAKYQEKRWLARSPNTDSNSLDQKSRFTYCPNCYITLIVWSKLFYQIKDVQTTEAVVLLAMRAC